MCIRDSFGTSLNDGCGDIRQGGVGDGGLSAWQWSDNDNGCDSRRLVIFRRTSEEGILKILPKERDGETNSICLSFSILVLANFLLLFTLSNVYSLVSKCPYLELNRHQPNQDLHPWKRSHPFFLLFPSQLSWFLPFAVHLPCYNLTHHPMTTRNFGSCFFAMTPIARIPFAISCGVASKLFVPQCKKNTLGFLVAQDLLNAIKYDVAPSLHQYPN